MSHPCRIPGSTLFHSFSMMVSELWFVLAPDAVCYAGKIDSVSLAFLSLRLLQEMQPPMVGALNGAR